MRVGIGFDFNEIVTEQVLQRAQLEIVQRHAGPARLPLLRNGLAVIRFVLSRLWAALRRFADSFGEQVQAMRTMVEQRLASLQADNEKKLEQMRATVDEKLHATLEQRLGQSFQQVAERLEQVHKGLGEMQTLAAGVGDLKRVLSNVKTRGGYGEVQLANLLEQVLTREQYAANVATRPGSDTRVEFAIRLPGTQPDAPCWLPIDANQSSALL